MADFVDIPGVSMVDGLDLAIYYGGGMVGREGGREREWGEVM